MALELHEAAVAIRRRLASAGGEGGQGGQGGRDGAQGGSVGAQGGGSGGAQGGRIRSGFCSCGVPTPSMASASWRRDCARVSVD